MIALRPDPEKMSAAAAVAGNVELVNVRLKATHASCEIEPRTLKGSILSDLAFDVVGHEIPEAGWLTVEAHLHLGLFKRSGPAKERTSIASFGLNFVAIYRTPEEPMPEKVRNALPVFAQLNGIYHCWPYLRCELQRLTSAMGLAPFVLEPLVVRPGGADESGEQQKSKSRSSERRVRKPTRDQTQSD